jgi:hypothetical protein
LHFATRAFELNDWKDPNDLAILAAAHAGSGDFDSAIKVQEKANALYTDDVDRKVGEKRLKLYQEGKPYRREPRVPMP